MQSCIVKILLVMDATPLPRLAMHDVDAAAKFSMLFPAIIDINRDSLHILNAVLGWMDGWMGLSDMHRKMHEQGK